MMMPSVLLPGLRRRAGILRRRPLEFVVARGGAEVISSAAVHRSGSSVRRVDCPAANGVLDVAARRCIAVPAVLVATHHVSAAAVAHHEVEKTAPNDKPGEALQAFCIHRLSPFRSGVPR